MHPSSVRTGRIYIYGIAVFLGIRAITVDARNRLTAEGLRPLR